MTFDEVLAQVQALLQREQRVSYRGLKRRFALDDEYLEDLKEELIGAKRLATDEDGRFLVWRGEQEPAVALSRLPSHQPPVPPVEPRPPEAERRQLTVEFIDLVGSTILSAQLDPEEYRDLVRAYQQASAAVIERFDGHVAQYLGDGLLVYFGYPTAHEDDAARAVRVGLRIIEALQALNPRLTRPLQVRIGIHTGPVVVGEMGGGRHQEQLALGVTPNLAARIQGTAAPDEVVISAATHHLVEGLFDCEDRGQPALKGVATPLTLYRVVKEEEVQSRFQVVVRKGLTPLVGREHEYRLLCERWQRVKDGAGQVVLLSGEPGIGKSRLVEALKETIKDEGAPCLELRCSPYHQNSALYPITDHLQRLLQFAPEELPDAKMEKLQQRLLCYRFPQPETLPLLAALLSLPFPAGMPPLALSPQKQKERTLATLVSWLVEETERGSLSCAWEDLHWADPSTLELLTLLLDQVPSTRMLVLLMFRPEFTPPWGTHSYLSQMTLSRLGRTHAEAMVEKVAGGTALPTAVVQQIVNKTDGVPLFVEELTKTVLESVESIGSIESIGSAIPATLHDSLMARLDRLGAAKEIAQVGATIGREFSYDLLEAVSSLNEETLQGGLKQLVEAELVYQSGVLPQARYLFKHALIQDTAYQSLLKSTRQQYHQQIAQRLEEQFPDTKETQPELLAYHYTEAGLIKQAIPYWQQAGKNATQRSAYVEAVAHLTKGLELLKTLADTPERVREELTLQMALSVPLMVTKGYAALEVEQVFTRARELCRQVGETPQLFSILLGLSSFYMVQAELKTARELAEQCFRLAQNTHSSPRLIWAHNQLGQTLSFLGEIALAQDHMMQGIALYDPQKHRLLVSGTTQDPGVSCLCFASRLLWLLGYPDQALARIREALTLAQELSHPFSLAFTFRFAAALHQYRRERLAAQEWAEKTIVLATEQGFPFWSALGTILRGWVLTEQGQIEEGMVQIRQGLTAYRATGAEYAQPSYLALLAEAYGKGKQAKEGLSFLAEALALVDKTGECWWEAELYRLKGELLLAQAGHQGKTEEVEQCFRKAMAVARHQQAKSLELRAATSCARLWHQQGKPKEAHAMLAEIYHWFTEGFDTKDLQEAKAWLDELEEGH